MLVTVGATSNPLRTRHVPLSTLYVRVPEEDVPNILASGVLVPAATAFVVCQMRKNLAVVADHANCGAPFRV
jgi:hypothetical protein